jgi:hypothetical protein
MIGGAYFAKIMAMCSGVMQSIVACPKPVMVVSEQCEQVSGLT